MYDSYNPRIMVYFHLSGLRVESVKPFSCPDADY
ncbi:MAG: hypothetical protein ACI92C_001520, partial [Neolewinella sp.]